MNSCNMGPHSHPLGKLMLGLKLGHTLGITAGIFNTRLMPTSPGCPGMGGLHQDLLWLPGHLRNSKPLTLLHGADEVGVADCGADHQC